jgi:CPA2 family monovalent cation:H+ antiporter-2
MAATSLAQIGEFSFVMLGVAATYNLIEPTHANNLMAAAVFSMLLTPFALSLAPALAAGVGKFRVVSRLLDVTTAEDASESSSKMKDHVIIGGYGLAGHDLATALKDSNIPHAIVDINPENVRMGLQRGEPIFYGDITSPEVLGFLGAAQARTFVIVVNDQTAIEMAVKAARSVSPNLHIVVRTRYLQDVARLSEAGAADVIVAEVVTAAEVVATILKLNDIKDYNPRPAD